MKGLSLRAEEELLKSIPSRGMYSVVMMGRFASVIWRHGVSERVLIQFLTPNLARFIAASCNFVHRDPRTGDVTRNWEMLKAAWWDGKKEPSRILLPAGFGR
ncbi:MAG: hypothetical protein ACLGXA_25270 [Acidobacteriota bacterium]